MFFKNLIKYILILLPWFLSSIIVRDYSYYKNISLPSFAPPSWAFPIAWSIIYILLAYSIYKVIKDSNKSYKITLLINYVLNQFFVISFFLIKDNFISFINTLAVLISTLFLYYETNEIDKKKSKFIIPYIIWDIFATILSLGIVFLN